jgi:hypothetical protein
MGIHKKMGGVLLPITLVSLLLSTTARAEPTPSFAYLSTNYESCTGHCEKININCDQQSTAHGSVAWCEKNCINRDKADEYQFLQGINYCKSPQAES